MAIRVATRDRTRGIGGLAFLYPPPNPHTSRQHIPPTNMRARERNNAMPAAPFPPAGGRWREASEGVLTPAMR